MNNCINALFASLFLTLILSATAQENTWVNVTPDGLDVGTTAPTGWAISVFDVVVDPAIPTDFYAFTSCAGVWKSTDCGATWSLITAPGVMTSGIAWGVAIDPNPLRDPSTPPRLWATQGYGGWEGVWTSADGGVTWLQTHSGVAGKDGIYSYDVDPFDSDHLLAGLHETTGILESFDGGATWRFIATVGSGNSIYPFFVNTGDPATTRTTWLAVGQVDAGGTMYRTVNSGADWVQVLAAGHPHGSSQLYTAPNRDLYFCGYGSGGGVFKSSDEGQTWTMVSSISGSSIVGTPQYIYASSSQLWPGPCGTGGNPNLQRASAVTGTSWQSMPAPACMNDGAHRMAVGFDGSHYVVVSGNAQNGIWRFVESETTGNAARSMAAHSRQKPDIRMILPGFTRSREITSSSSDLFTLQGRRLDGSGFPDLKGLCVRDLFAE